METSQRRADDGQKISFIPKLSQVFFNTDGNGRFRYELFGQGKDGSNRLVLLSLGLLNIVLLFAAIIIGIKCANLKAASLQVSHAATAELIAELTYLRGNYSDVIKAKEEARNALEAAFKNHVQLKLKIKRQKSISDDYLKQVHVLQTEKSYLQSNISSLEGTCGKCHPQWILHNSSCYFFSFLESESITKTWPDSRADCVRRGADLVIIDSKEEQEFVSTSIENLRGTRDVWRNGFWIGVTDTHTEGKWMWINNVTEVEERYWMEGEPNDHGRHGEDCGVAVYSPDNPWKSRYDGSCNTAKLHWLCEIKLA
ncbi:uncharacterized protein V6R79_014479 [Siganus canaliculatus]